MTFWAIAKAALAARTPGARDFVQSLERGLAVIPAFDGEHRELRLTEVAEHLGYSNLSGLSFGEIAQPHMERLVHQVNESSSISVLDDTDVVYAVRVPTRRITTITLAVGTRLPAYATSMGRVLLASLPPEELESRLKRITLRKLTPHTITTKKALREEFDRVRAQGFAMVDQELEEGLHSAAVPIVDAEARVAALNISVHASRTSMDDLRDDFLPKVQATARAIERCGPRHAPRPLKTPVFLDAGC